MQTFYKEAKQAAEEMKVDELKDIIRLLFDTNCIYEVEHDQQKIAAIKKAKEAIQ